MSGPDKLKGPTLPSVPDYYEEDNEPKPDLLETASTFATKGLLLGFDDEIMAGADKYGDYNKRLSAIQSQQEAAFKANPYTAIGSQVVGGLLPTLTGMGLGARAGVAAGARFGQLGGAAAGAVGRSAGGAVAQMGQVLGQADFQNTDNLALDLLKGAAVGVFGGVGGGGGRLALQGLAAGGSKFMPAIGQLAQSRAMGILADIGQGLGMAGAGTFGSLGATQSKGSYLQENRDRIAATEDAIDPISFNQKGLGKNLDQLQLDIGSQIKNSIEKKDTQALAQSLVAGRLIMGEEWTNKRLNNPQSASEREEEAYGSPEFMAEVATREKLKDIIRGEKNIKPMGLDDLTKKIGGLDLSKNESLKNLTNTVSNKQAFDKIGEMVQLYEQSPVGFLERFGADERLNSEAPKTASEYSKKLVETMEAVKQSLPRAAASNSLSGRTRDLSDAEISSFVKKFESQFNANEEGAFGSLAALKRTKQLEAIQGKLQYNERRKLGKPNEAYNYVQRLQSNFAQVDESQEPIGSQARKTGPKIKINNPPGGAAGLLKAR